MKSIVLAAAGFLLLLSAWSAVAENTNPNVRAAMTVYAHIVETEAIIDMCRRMAVADATPYDKVYKKYQGEIRDVVVRIGYLVGQESRHAGVDKQSLFKSLDTMIDQAVDTSEQMARADPERFAFECKTLPNAMIEQTKLFEPLTMRFPDEMKIIQNRL